MTYQPGYHWHLVEIGGQLHLQISFTFPHSSLQTISSDNGSFTVQAEMNCDCPTILKRLAAISPAWPLPTGLTEMDLRPLSFRLCDPSDREVLETFGILKRSSPSSEP